MKNRKMIFLLSILMLSVLVSCEKDDENGNGDNKDMSSRYSENESHNTGQNCMSCHKSGGSGKGWFIAAGTVYNSTGNAVYPNATVKLYTGANGTGTLVKTIEVDGKGNFYTTADVNYGLGLYVTVTGTSGNVSKMGSSINTGACNSCHGSSIGKITVN